MKTSATRRRSRFARPLSWLVVAGLAGAALIGPSVGGVSAAVSVTPINSGNPTCDDFAPEGESWTQFKLEGSDLANGTYTDGTLTVTISNFVDSSSGTPGSFDWSSNIGVDAVFVKAGDDKHNLYVYDPEATGDTGLHPQAGNGNGISHISFCYDEDTTTTTSSSTTDTTTTDTTTTDTTTTDTTTTDTTTTDTTTTDTTTTDTTSTGTESSITSTTETTETTSSGTESGITTTNSSSSTSEGGVLPTVGTPGLTPPTTDTVGAVTPAGSPDGYRFILLGMAFVLAVILLLQPKEVASRKQ